MARARLLTDDAYPTAPLPVAQPVPETVHRQVTGDVTGAAERSAQGYNAPSYTSPATTRTGNPKTDWMNLVNGLAPSVQSIAQVFPQFAEMYPGSTYERADIKGPWGWFDSIADLGSGDVGKKWQTYSGSGTSGKLQSPYSAQFSDPLTRQYEKLLQSQTKLYNDQQAAMKEEAAQKKLVRSQTDAAVARLTDFLNKRIDTLEQPAYTDSEAEVLKTRLLDPLEADRTASRQRALNNVGSRGFDPTSGIAQQLFQDVDRVYDKERTRAHGDIAYEQIQEERSRDQEAQELLKYLTQLPMASARGDLDFVNYLDNLVSRPGEQALGTSALMADLPVQRTRLALEALGLGGQPQSSINGVLQLLDNSQRNRLIDQQSRADFWRNIGF